MTGSHAVTITGCEQAELLAVPADDAPLGPCDVAGSTVASLISAGTELAYNFQGKQFPSTPGYAAVFQVDAVGAEVSAVQPGDLAFCMGPHRSWQRQPEHLVIKVPDGLAPRQAVFARLMGVSMSTLTTTVARPGARVIVTGLGSVGHLAATIFASCGYKVLACDPDVARRAIAEQHGIVACAALPLDDPDWMGKTALVLECSGHEQAVLDACRVVAKRGEVVLVGVPWQPRTQILAHDILHAVFHRYVVLRSGWEWEVPLQPTDFVTGSIVANLRTALEWIVEGRVRVDGLAAAYAPDRCQQAYENLLHHREEKLAAVFDWG